jgi:hypothetical protein
VLDWTLCSSTPEASILHTQLLLFCTSITERKDQYTPRNRKDVELQNETYLKERTSVTFVELFLPQSCDSICSVQGVLRFVSFHTAPQLKIGISMIVCKEHGLIGL